MSILYKCEKCGIPFFHCSPCKAWHSECICVDGERQTIYDEQKGNSKDKNMSAFETLSLMRLYSMAEQNFKNGRGDKKVWIEAKKSDKIILINTYEDICSLFNRGKQMTWEHLFKVLSLKMKNTVIVLPE